jgi:N-formylglutamate amidohydrolase
MDDEQEPMTAKGMGVCYETNSFGGTLRTVSAGEKQSIIEEYYKPHHAKLEKAVNGELTKNGEALIIDCHSFPDTPLPHEDSQHRPRPDICIGTDDFHTPTRLAKLVVAHFRNLGYTVAVDDPFGGSIVPMSHYGKMHSFIA